MDKPRPEITTRDFAEVGGGGSSAPKTAAPSRLGAYTREAEWATRVISTG